MPMVNGKAFPYTEKGKKAAKMEVKKTAKKAVAKRVAKKTAVVRKKGM